MHPKTRKEDAESLARKHKRQLSESMVPPQTTEATVDREIGCSLVSLSVLLQCNLVCIDHSYDLMIGINYVLFRRHIFEPKRYHGEAFVVQVGAEQ
jgi:hypothetical protein